MVVMPCAGGAMNQRAIVCVRDDRGDVDSSTQRSAREVSAFALMFALQVACSFGYV